MPRRLYLLFAAALVACSVFSSSAIADKVVKVYLLAGQSNMEGKGLPTHLDTYKDDPLIKPWYSIVKEDGAWAVRDDVFITYPSKSGGAKHGPLTVGYGTKGEDSIGPEWGFGHFIGEAVDEPVLIIKVAWGGKSVYQPFRPPSAMPSDAELRGLLADMQQKHDQAVERNKAREKEGKRVRKPRAVPSFDELKQSFGASYRKMVEHVQEELADYENKFPALKGYKPELAGFVWHQGFNDAVASHYKANGFDDYTRWTAILIDDLRKALNAPKMPVVIGELGTKGVDGRGDFQVAQANIDKIPAFRGTVKFVPTAQYQDKVALAMFEQGVWKQGKEGMAKWLTVGNDRPYHYLGSGKWYFLKGVAFGQAMVELEKR